MPKKDDSLNALYYSGDIEVFNNGIGNNGFPPGVAAFSGLGQFIGQGSLSRPQIPASTRDYVGIDLTHEIHVDFAAAKGGPGGGGGGGGGGGTTFVANPYTSGTVNGTAGFDIALEFKGTWTEPLYNIFKAAADRLTTLITSDLANISLVGGKGPPRNIDDILITAELRTIDGAGGILGQAGPTAIRTNGSLPVAAIMQFDIADAASFNGQDLFDDIVLHEMAHSLGFGSIWDIKGLVSGGLYTGTQANAQYVAMGGTGAIPVEADGGGGTAGSHWDEETFANELMTGYIDDHNYFTAMSEAAFVDLGYQISGQFLALADSGYTLPG